MSGHSFSQSQRDRFSQHVGRMASQLRDLADQIERDGTPRGDTPEHHMTAAADVHRSLAWGFANLNADTLVMAASDLSVAVALETDD